MFNIVEGWTEPVLYSLKYSPAGIVTAFPLAGCTVEFEAWDQFNAAITLTGTTDVVDEDTGSVSFTPAAGDILATNSPMKVRWKVTTPSGIAFFPNGAAEIWTVFKP